MSKQSIQINTDFKDGQAISYKLSATGEKSICCVVKNNLKMLSGRLYYVPVDTEEDSDKYSNIQVFSKVSEKIDIRYIQNKIACIIPLQHNVEISISEKLCTLWR